MTRMRGALSAMGRGTRWLGWGLAVGLAVGLSPVPAHGGGRAGGRGLSLRQRTARLTLVFVIDRSGSMTGTKMRTTRTACQSLVARLRARDRVGVVAFDTRPQQMLAVQAVGSGAVAKAAIGRIAATGGTQYLSALVMAERMLTRAPHRAKERRHVLFLSDGQAPRAGVLDLVRKLRRQGITLSTVAISAAADRGFLSKMARAGGGRALYVPHISTLQRMLRRELRQLGR